MKTIHILGTAPSIKNYKPNGCETIGVNDIFKYHEVDNLLLLDKSITFDNYRLLPIVNSKPKQFYSTQQEWQRFFPGMIKIKTCEKPGIVHSLDSDNYIFHCDSTFTAVHLAYKKQAKNIVLYGVDFTGEKWENKKTPILRAYNDLNIALRDRGVMLSVGSPTSLLTQILNYQS